MGNFKEQGTEPTQSQKDANNLRRLTRTKQHNLRVVLILLTSPCGSQNLEKNHAYHHQFPMCAKIANYPEIYNTYFSESYIKIWIAIYYITMIEITVTNQHNEEKIITSQLL